MRVFAFFKQNRNLKYGHIGLLLANPTRLKNKQMLKLRLYLKRASKRSDKTQRLAWVNMFPHLPLTRKPKQSRMGKGKGKLSAWFIFLRAGTILVELRNLRFGRSLFFLNRLSKKLHVPSFLLKSSSNFVHSNLLISKKLILKMYW